MANITDEQLLAIVDNLIVDKHISTTCVDFVKVCYNIFYNTTQLDVTFTVGSTSYTIPNVAKNTGVTSIEGVIDPESHVEGVLGQIYYNSLNKKVFFKSNASGTTGWVLLFQYVASPNEEDALDNLNQLLTTTENIVGVYYDIFYNTTPKDVTLEVYENGTLVEKTIPNRAKSLVVALSGSTNPEGSVDGTLGRIYVYNVSSSTKYVYVKTTVSGNTGWSKLLNADDITTHNTSSTAHQGFLARLNGDENQPFNVSTPTLATHAVNVQYTGNLNNLTTLSKDSFVNSINEVKADVDALEEKLEEISDMPVYCINSGNVDLDGNSDLLTTNASTSTLQIAWYQPTLASNGTMGTSELACVSALYGTDAYKVLNGAGTAVNVVGGTFDFQTATAIKLYSLAIKGDYETDTYGTVYPYNCSGILYAGSSSSDLVQVGTFSADYGDYTINTYNLNTAYSYYRLSFTAGGSWQNIGHCSSIKITATKEQSVTFGTGLSFKVGGSYSGITVTKANSKNYTKTFLPTIDCSSLRTGTYNIMVPEIGNAYTTNNTVSRQKTQPANPATGDIWMNTAVLPITTKKWDGTTWEDFEDVNIGTVTILNTSVRGYITAYKTLPYNSRNNSTPTGAIPASLVESYSNGTSWYRVWSNGWIEQGGQVSLTTSASTISLTYLKTFSDTNYNITATCTSGYAYYGSKATSSFTLTGSASSTCTWRACGF